MKVSYNDRVRKCEICGEIVSVRNKDAKYCSSSCRGKAFRRKKKMDKLLGDVKKGSKVYVKADRYAAKELLKLINKY